MKLKDLFRDHGLPWVNRNYLIEKETELATALELIANIRADLARKDKQYLDLQENYNNAINDLENLRMELTDTLAKLQELADLNPEPTGGSMGGVTE
jgi:hypothetical protein